MLIVNRSNASSFGCVKIGSTGRAAAVELVEWEGVNRQQTLDYKTLHLFLRWEHFKNDTTGALPQK